MNFLRCSRPDNFHFNFYLKNNRFLFNPKPLNHMIEAKKGPNYDLYSSYNP